MDLQQFVIEALRMGARIEIHGPGSSEADEHEQEEAEHGEGNEEGASEDAAEGSEEADDNATGYNQAAKPDGVRAEVMRALARTQAG